MVVDGWGVGVHQCWGPDPRAVGVMRDDVTLFLVTSKRDLVVKISRELKRNIVHIEQVLEILQNER